MGSRGRPFFFLLEAQFFEEKAPNHIQPADDDTGRYGNYDTDNQPKNSAFFEPGLHLTIISTTQFTPGMRRRIICTRRGSLLNQVIFPLLIKYL